MTRLRIRQRLNAVSERLRLSTAQRVYLRLLVATLVSGLAGTGVIAGLPALALMVAQGTILGIVGAALAVSFGAIILIAVYVWITI